MKRFYFATLLTITSFFTQAQGIAVNDSVTLGAGTSDMVFYQLSTGTKTVSSNTDWDLAITVRATQFPNAPLGGTTIRINEANGVHAIYVPNADATGFNTLDTAGWQSWRKLHDSDTAVDEGALNSNRSSNIFDFGWGVYNSGSHNVVGDSLYLIQLRDGSLRKFLVVDLDKDTVFNIQYANIDNSGLQNLKISKKDYVGKQFVYLDMQTNTLRDKEPLASTWDLQFLKYAANDVLPDTAYPVVGVWVNKSETVAEARGVDVTNNNYGGYTFTDNLNEIGWDWKSFNNQTFQYEIADSLAYFVKSGSLYYKVVFTGFGGSSTGNINFYVVDLNSATGINEVAETSFVMFPNPSNNQVNVVGSSAISSVAITDLSGKIVAQESINASTAQLSTYNLTNGIYLLHVHTTNGVASKKLVVNH